MNKIVKFLLVSFAALAIASPKPISAAPACTCARFNMFRDHGCHGSPEGAGSPTSGANNGGGNSANCPTCPPPRWAGADASAVSTGALGMARWWVDEPYINLHLVDEPLSYKMSSGKDMVFRFVYKQNYQMPQPDQIPNLYYTYFSKTRDQELFTFPYIHAMQGYAGTNPVGDSFQERTNGMTNAAWMHNWQGFILLWDANWEASSYNSGPAFSASTAYSGDWSYEALAFMPDGGIDYFTDGQDNQTINSTWQERDPVSQVQLLSFPDPYYPTPFYTGGADANGIYWGAKNPSGSSTNGLILYYSDGSYDVYGLTFWAGGGNSAAPDSTAGALLTERVDPQGRITKLGYMWDSFTNACNGVAYASFRLHYVVDPDGATSTLFYSTSSPAISSQLQEIEDPFGRTATFNYEGCGSGSQRGWLTTITDAQGNSSVFTYQSGNDGQISSLVTPYGTNNFYYAQAIETDATNAFTQRGIYVTEPDNASQLFCYIHKTSNSVESATNPPVVSGCLFDDGSNGGADEALYHRNSFYWDRRQTTALSSNVTQYLPINLSLALSYLASSQTDLQKGRMRHWLLDADGISITETLSSERDPSPDSAGMTEGERTWYSYGNCTPADQYTNGGITSDIIAAIARILPDGSSQYTQYTYGWSTAPWIVTQTAQSYTQPNGTVGALTTYYNYSSTNLVDVLQISNSSAQFVKLGYNGSHEVTAITNALNQVTRLSYANSMNLTNIAFYSGKNISLIYDAGGDPYLRQIAFQPENLTITVPFITGFGFAYDGYCNAYSISNGYANPNCACGCLPQALEISGTGFPAFGLTNTWDNLNRLTSVTYPDGTYISNIYTYLDLSAHKDRLGHWTYYTHDGLQHLTTITDARSNLTTLTWCDCGALTSISNALGNLTYLNYNNQELLTNVEFPDASSMTWQYDLIGRVTNSFDGAGKSLQYSYNNQSMVTAVSNVYGQVMGVYRDALGRPNTITNANNVVVTNTYDLLNRITQRSWLGGSSENFGYASNGLIAYTNQDGQWTLFGRDGASRMTAMTNVVQTNLFGYNALDELTSLIDGLSHPTSWGYNQYGWLISKTNALGTTILKYSYDSDGEMTNRWMMGTNTQYRFDMVGNVTNIIYPNASYAYQYDAVNELTNMTDSTGTTRFTWTQTGQLQSETGPWSSDTLTLGYNQGDRTSLSLTQPSGTWLQTYGYDSEWRMTGITSPAGAFGYAYATPNPASRLISGITLPNSAFITNTYDSLARLTGTALANQFGHVLDGYVYGLDLLGLRTNITRNLGLTTNTVAVGYDGIDELTSWSGKEIGDTLRHNEQLAYAYDPAGNLHVRTNDALVQTFNVDSLNQLSTVSRTGLLTVTGATPVPATSVKINGTNAQTYGDFTFAGGTNNLTTGINNFTNIAQNIHGVYATNILTLNLPATVTFQYDANGNLTNDGMKSFQYDAENRLTNVWIAGQWQVGFIYDGLSRRRVEQDYAWQSGAWLKTNEFRFIDDGRLVIQERDSNNAVLVTYTRGLDLSQSLTGAGGIGGLLARTDANGSIFYHADAQGNVTSLIDAFQRIPARYEYDAFGRLINKQGSLADANRMQYSSMPMFHGLVGYPYRFYDSNPVRFLNRDPLGEAGGINLYGFVGNNPVNKLDPFGLAEVDFFTPTSSQQAVQQASDQVYAAQAAAQLLNQALANIADILRYPGNGTVGGEFEGVFENAFEKDVQAAAEDLVNNLAKPKPKVNCPAKAKPISNPPTGQPGSKATATNPDGTPKQVRQYGPDGYPETDVDYGHGHELDPNGNPVGSPHVHDWEPNPNGGFPNRGPARPPQPGDPQP